VRWRRLRVLSEAYLASPVHPEVIVVRRINNRRLLSGDNAAFRGQGKGLALVDIYGYAGLAGLLLLGPGVTDDLPARDLSRLVVV